jgi:hypothetical protein
MEAEAENTTKRRSTRLLEKDSAKKVKKNDDEE